MRAVFAAFSYLNRAEALRIPLVILSTILSALLGLFGLAAVLPFLQLMVKPDPLALDSTLGKVFNAIGVSSPLTAIAVAGSGFAALMVLKSVHAVLHMRLLSKFCSRCEVRMATEALRRVVEAPYAWSIRQNSSVLRDLIMTCVVDWSRGIIRPTLNLANNGLMLISAIVLLVVWTPLAALVVGAATMAVGYVFVAMARPKIALSGQRKRQHRILAEIAASEAITGGRDVRMSPAGQLLINEFHRDFSIYAHADADARQWQIIPRQGIEAVGVFAIIGMAMVALFTGADRIETTSMLALYAVVAVRLLPIIGEFTNAISVIQVVLPNFSHLESRLKELSNQTAERPSGAQFKGWSRIRLDGAGYTYEGEDNAALQRIDFTFERGLSYGLVGSSGAGKSTLADVVVGLLAPTSGSVSIDGVTLTNESRTAWRGRAAYVSQSPVIFDTTLADNIALGHPSGAEREARLAAAIAAAGLESVVAGLDRGADTQIGDRGVRLSGGQRQRVAIARAIYQDSDLLVLDEATSALDSLTERDVTAAIDALKGRLTMIVIAHRLSSVVQCDKILVLDQGRLSAAGSHAELVSRSSVYQSFVKLQATVSQA